ncbi:hypothetical protein ACOMHN_011839 [Nucella lapillus]
MVSRRPKARLADVCQFHNKLVFVNSQFAPSLDPCGRRARNSSLSDLAPSCRTDYSEYSAFPRTVPEWKVLLFSGPSCACLQGAPGGNTRLSGIRPGRGFTTRDSATCRRTTLRQQPQHRERQAAPSGLISSERSDMTFTASRTRAAQHLCGPGHSISDLRCCVTQLLKSGDVREKES